mgnify:CR=1 FL=1
MKRIPYDFDMIYDDWMIIETLDIKKSDVIKDMFKYVELKYSQSTDEESEKEYDYFLQKALAAHQKLAMMYFAEYNIHNVKSDFESTQNMEIPALYGVGKTQLLFYVESMILFARNALDVAATVYSKLILNRRTDSYNEFSKRILSSDDPLLKELKTYLENHSNDTLSAFRLLCGTEKGRALRDIIVHQANINLQYLEYKENSDKERLFLILKDTYPIDFNNFVLVFLEDVEELFIKTNNCLKVKVESTLKK